MGKAAQLPRDAARGILILNDSIPPAQKELWVTPQDIRNRLVLGGVDRALTTEHVDNALCRFNKGDVFLTRRQQSHDGESASYFRSSLFADGCPDDQRLRTSGRPSRELSHSILPPGGNIFVWDEKTRRHLSAVNRALVDLDRPAARPATAGGGSAGRKRGRAGASRGAKKKKAESRRAAARGRGTGDAPTAADAGPQGGDARPVPAAAVAERGDARGGDVRGDDVPEQLAGPAPGDDVPVWLRKTPPEQLAAWGRLVPQQPIVGWWPFGPAWWGPPPSAAASYYGTTATTYPDYRGMDLSALPPAKQMAMAEAMIEMGSVKGKRHPILRWK